MPKATQSPAPANEEGEATTVEAQPAAPIYAQGPHVYVAIADITAQLAVEGIGKTHQATGAGANYAFRGIDDVYNALAVKLGKHRLVIIPRVMSREQETRTSRNGGAVFYTTITVEYDLVSAIDGSKHTACVVGEAMDSGDKSSNKSLSAAFKYMAFQVFCIPVEAQDSEEQTHELAPPMTALQKAIQHLRSSSVDQGTFKSAWEINKNPWKGLLDASDYQLLVSEMRTIAASIPPQDETAKEEFRPAPAPPRSRFADPPAAEKPIGEDDIPAEFR
jgi:hypothetical protein